MTRRAGERGMTAIEVAITFAIVGSVLAVAIPAFVRDLHASRFAEPVDGIKAIAAAATTYAAAHDVAHAYPASAPLTPAHVPQGKREVDPPQTWDDPTWRTFAFRASPEGIPHAFSFAFDSAVSPTRSTFIAHAHGDLDGDTVTSTFEIHGHDAAGEPAPVIEPGMVVSAEVE